MAGKFLLVWVVANVHTVPATERAREAARLARLCKADAARHGISAEALATAAGGDLMAFMGNAINSADAAGREGDKLPKVSPSDKEAIAQKKAKVQAFYEDGKAKGHHPQDILKMMIEHGFNDYYRFHALRNAEHMTVREAKAFKEISEPWLEGRVTKADYERGKEGAIARDLRLKWFFR